VGTPERSGSIPSAAGCRPTLWRHRWRPTVQAQISKKPDGFAANILHPSHPKNFLLRVGLGQTEGLPGGLADQNRTFETRWKLHFYPSSARQGPYY